MCLVCVLRVDVDSATPRRAVATVAWPAFTLSSPCVTSDSWRVGRSKAFIAFNIGPVHMKDDAERAEIVAAARVALANSVLIVEEVDDGHV